MSSRDAVLRFLQISLIAAFTFSINVVALGEEPLPDLCDLLRRADGIVYGKPVDFTDGRSLNRADTPAQYESLLKVAVETAYPKNLLHTAQLSINFHFEGICADCYIPDIKSRRPQWFIVSKISNGEAVIYHPQGSILFMHSGRLTNAVGGFAGKNSEKVLSALEHFPTQGFDVKRICP